MDKILRKPVEPSDDDLDPHYGWGRALPAWGTMGVDFELRIDFDRLRRYRIGRAKQALENSKLGALLLFDVNNIRYVTSTKIGEWERDKLCRFALLPKGGEPILWDFGSAAVHHRLYSPWLLKEHCRAGVIGMRGTIPPTFGLMKQNPAIAGIPVLLLTAKVQGVDQRRFANLGVSAVLFKPFDPLTLAQQISEALGWKD